MTNKQAYAGLTGELHLIANMNAQRGDETAALHIREAAEAISSLLKALDLACRILGDMEPPDSRAVSNEFVAMFSVLCGNANDECHEIIEAAIAEHEARAALNSDAPLSIGEGDRG